ncbi:MAG: DUF1574 family protein [Leptospiraceae bacterium]|nr:DUF1574 family protein [Leptospiraceae bacterium]
MKRSVIYYPLMLLAAVLLVDKTFEIPVIRDRTRQEITTLEVLDRYAARVLAEVQTSQSPHSVRKTVLFLGTSRSMTFLILNDLEHDEFLSVGRRRFLSDYHFEARLAFPLPDVLSQLMIADRLRAMDVRVDTIVFDLSPFVLYNHTLLESRIRQNVLPRKFLVRYLSEMPPDIRGQALGQLLFTTYRYRVRPERLFIRGGGEEVSPFTGAQRSDAMAAQLIANPLTFTIESLDDVRADDISPAEFDRRFAALNAAAFDSLYVDYDRRAQARKLLEAIFTILEGHAEHVILWLPPVHPSFRRTVYAELEPEDDFWKRYHAILSEAGAKRFAFYNGYRSLAECDYWLDASHYSGRCYGLLIHAMMQCTLQHNRPDYCVFPEQSRDFNPDYFRTVSVDFTP